MSPTSLLFKPSQPSCHRCIDIVLFQSLWFEIITSGPSYFSSPLQAALLRYRASFPRSLSMEAPHDQQARHQKME